MTSRSPPRGRPAARSTPSPRRRWARAWRCSPRRPACSARRRPASRSARCVEAVAAGQVGPDDRVVLLVTGDGLKTPGPVAHRLQPVRIDADADALLDRLASRLNRQDFVLTEVALLFKAGSVRSPDDRLATHPGSRSGAGLGARLQAQPVERIKRDKSPLGILDELPALIAAGYEQMPEEDMVRLKWWGLYHDKPKVGTFMLRVKLPGGRVSPAGLRAIGEISNTFGRGDGELSTRQNVQLHWIELAALPEVFDRLHAAGLTSAGGCGDAVRNITGCPVAGVDHGRAVRHPADRRRGGRVLLRQPRVLEPAAQAQDHDRGVPRPLQRAGDQLHLADRRRPRGRRRLRDPGRGRALVGAPDRTRPRTSSSRRKRRSRCCGRSSTPGRRTSATASHA